MSDNLLVLGLDPGKTGGIAWQVLGDRKSAGVYGFKQTTTEADIARCLSDAMSIGRDCFAYIERVGATPQMGCVSAFSFGRSYGLLRGLLVGLGVPFEEVTPMRWQADFGLRMLGKKLGTKDTEKHNAIKAKAQQLFPWLQVTHSKAAALLISEYGARMQRMQSVA